MREWSLEFDLLRTGNKKDITRQVVFGKYACAHLFHGFRQESDQGQIGIPRLLDDDFMGIGVQRSLQENDIMGGNG